MKTSTETYKQGNKAPCSHPPCWLSLPATSGRDLGSAPSLSFGPQPLPSRFSCTCAHLQAEPSSNSSPTHTSFLGWLRPLSEKRPSLPLEALAVWLACLFYHPPHAPFPLTPSLPPSLPSPLPQPTPSPLPPPPHLLPSPSIPTPTSHHSSSPCPIPSSLPSIAPAPHHPPLAISLSP